MLGINAKLYRNTGSYASPTWTEVDTVSDMQASVGWDEAESAARDSRAKTMSKTLLNLEFSGKIRTDETDTDFIAFRDASYQDTVVDLMILNGPSDTVGVFGWRGEFGVFGFDEDQGLGTHLFDDFTLKPEFTTNGPVEWVVVESGTPNAPAFTDV